MRARWGKGEVGELRRTSRYESSLRTRSSRMPTLLERHFSPPSLHDTISQPLLPRLPPLARGPPRSSVACSPSFAHRDRGRDRRRRSARPTTAHRFPRLRRSRRFARMKRLRRLLAHRTRRRRTRRKAISSLHPSSSSPPSVLLPRRHLLDYPVRARTRRGRQRHPSFTDREAVFDSWGRRRLEASAKGADRSRREGRRTGYVVRMRRDGDWCGERLRG